jgi:threonyl-tRNA synthetase
MMKSFRIHLKDQLTREVEAKPIPAKEALRQLHVANLEKVIAVRIDGEPRDLSTLIDSEVELEPIFLESEEGLEILRHSTSHVMAMAVKDLFPGVKVTIGPAIENGFYYDFDYERPFREDDLPKIEEKMKEIVKANLPFKRSEMRAEEAIALFKDEGEGYKVEIIEDLGEKRVSLYTQPNIWCGLCGTEGTEAISPQTGGGQEA